MGVTSTIAEPTVFGVIGPGRIGLCLARLALRAGFTVVVAGSAPLTRTRRIVEMFAPGARVATTAEVAERSDIVALCMPLSAYTDVVDRRFRADVVIDAMNYWPETDGINPQWDDPDRPTSTLVRDALAPTPVVKAFNHVAVRDLDANARPSGSPYRIGIAVAGDDAVALDRVCAVVDALGFDPVVAGDLAHSAVLEPAGPVFGAVLDGERLAQRLTAG